MEGARGVGEDIMAITEVTEVITKDTKTGIMVAGDSIITTQIIDSSLIIDNQVTMVTSKEIDISQTNVCIIECDCYLLLWQPWKTLLSEV